jgi:hypothetical protein
MLVNSFYVDDLVTGSDTPDGAFELYQRSKERLDEGGFKLRKWKSNDIGLKSKFEAGESSLSDRQVEDTYAKSTLGVSDGNKPHKVLGIGRVTAIR